MSSMIRTDLARLASPRVERGADLYTSAVKRRYARLYSNGTPLAVVTFQIVKL